MSIKSEIQGFADEFGVSYEQAVEVFEDEQIHDWTFANRGYFTARNRKTMREAMEDTFMMDAVFEDC